MKKRLLMLALLSCMSFVFLGAQEITDEESSANEDFTESVQDSESISEEDSDVEKLFDINQKGDQTLKISLGVDFALAPKKMNLANFAFKLDYNYYLTPNLMAGVNGGFDFASTYGRNMFYMLPILGSITYQFVFGNIEVPVTLNAGIAGQWYLDRTYWGLDVKPQIGCYYRYSPEWSFGLDVGCHFLPQWYKDSSNNRLGVFLEAELCVRYHF